MPSQPYADPARMRQLASIVDEAANAAGRDPAAARRIYKVDPDPSVERLVEFALDLGLSVLVVPFDGGPARDLQRLALETAPAGGLCTSHDPRGTTATMTAPEPTTVWGEIDGRQITFPMYVAEFNAATLMFDVAAAAARELLPGTAFDVVESAADRCQLVIALCDYRRNPWGDYNEVNVGFLARPSGAPDEGEAGSFIHRMPVDQEFTCKAGNAVMGFPKTVQRIDVDYAADAIVFELFYEAESALRIELPRPVQAGPAGDISGVSYSYLGGVPYQTRLDMQLGTAVDAASVQVELGSGVVADELRGLGLPCAPLFAAWGEGLSATFYAGEPVEA